MSKVIKKIAKRVAITCVVIGIGALIYTVGSLVWHSAMVQRQVKSIKSNYTGGLNRTVTVYDMQGNKIREFSGKFDIKESDNQVFFDKQDGKRVQIWNGTVISEED